MPTDPTVPNWAPMTCRVAISGSVPQPDSRVLMSPIDTEFVSSRMCVGIDTRNFGVTAETTLMVAHNRRVERPVTVPGNVHVDRADMSDHRLGAGAVTRVASITTFDLVFHIPEMAARLTLELGNRRVNSVLHTLHVTPARCLRPATEFVARKRTNGNTAKEARRAHKRQLANRIIRRMWTTTGELERPSTTSIRRPETDALDKGASSR